MKKSISLFAITCLAAFQLYAQRPKVTVLNIDTKGVPPDPAMMGNLVRTELDKLDTFEVMDRYDVNYVIEKNQLSVNNCYGKICLVEAGKVIGADKMLTGYVEKFGKNIVVTLKFIDVKTGTVQHTQIVEFLDLPEEIQSMVTITVNRMFGRKEDAVLAERLTKKFNYESSTNNPDKDILRLGGPRMGFIAFAGGEAEQLRRETKDGGYGAFPVMFQFGYQFEQQYLNEGNFQALFEFVPMITGLDQGKFFPSVSILNGLRSNLNGWEFAFGPTFSLTKKADGYYDGGVWKLEHDWKGGPENPNTNEIITRNDSRGDLALNSNFVIAVGKTIKSGKMNIPINAFFVPSNNGARFGISFGYNAKKRR
ncbi:MAG TPA: hypothetical protein VF691_12670 [Cytophagaceae bacterium]|jgi:hypothetical protein